MFGMEDAKVAYFRSFVWFYVRWFKLVLFPTDWNKVSVVIVDGRGGVVPIITVLLTYILGLGERSCVVIEYSKN